MPTKSHLIEASFTNLGETSFHPEHMYERILISYKQNVERNQMK